MKNEKFHVPVMLSKVIDLLAPKPNQNFIDATLGEGGHALTILKRTEPQGKLLGIEQNPKIIKQFQYQYKNSLKKRIILVCDNFVHLKEIVSKYQFKEILGILFDLGLSSFLLEKSGLGFSFKKDEPLIMRYGPEGLTASQIINSWPKENLEKIFKEYGQERFARKIALRIVAERKYQRIDTTGRLVKIILKAVPKKFYLRRIHPATKIFQALRITVNNELENLKKVLPQAIEVLEPKGRLIVISYHSLEDRIVKNFFKRESQDCLCPKNFPKCLCGHKSSLKIITKKPIKPTISEIKKNPRSRSAKLRVAEKI